MRAVSYKNIKDKKCSMTVRDTAPAKVIGKMAEMLEKTEMVKPPVWANIVKTGMSRERPPEQENWWYIRSASILRKLYFHQPLGLTKFRKAYGGRKNRGHKPEHTYRASGNHIRKILQQLEKAGLVKQEKGKGRTLTKAGKELLDNAAKAVNQAG